MLSRIKDTLLLIGDAESSRSDLRRIFQDSYNLLEAENAAQAVMLLEQNRSCIALVLMDLSSPSREEMDALMAATGAGMEHEIPTVAIVDSASGSEREERAFLLGAADVILKPYSPIAIQRRIQILVELFLHKWNLEKMVIEQSETIRNTNQVMLDALSAIIEYRSTESGNHVLRIRRFTKILLEEVARCCPEYELTDSAIDIIASAAALHDIGKISVPDAILNKPGPLTAEEFEIMKTHTTIGSRMVERLAGMGEEVYLRYAYNICLYHHERWDGKGYPCGLASDAIPICAQVVGLTDAFDALTTKRIYKPAYPYQSAINMILNGECGEFSPKLLECFKRVRTQFVELARRYADGYSPKADQIAVPLPGPAWKDTTLNSLELFQAKYQTLLHYIDDTVLELDLDNELYHVVYNPNPDLESVIPNASFSVIMEALRHSDIHPEDVGVLDEMQHFVTEGLFHLNLRRHAFSLRIFSPNMDAYQRYELVFLRVNTGNSNQRIVTAIWHRLDREQNALLPGRGTLHAAPALYGLVSSAVRCQSDRELTIDMGQKDLYPLTGYTEAEIYEEFDNKLINLVFPEDCSILFRAMEEAAQTGQKTEMEFRLLRKERAPVWVLAKSRSHVEANGQEYFYFAIRDNSKSKLMYQKLLSDIQRNQTLIDQSGSIIFDWDMLSDTMYCSPKWDEHFGYTPISQNYGAQMGIATHFHPDDLPLIRDYVEQLKAGVTTVAMDVRIANAAGKYLWTKITATACKDDKGMLVRIIGILQDIDELKRAALVLKERAEQDALTRLLNKASVQALVSDYLAERRENTLAGLLVLDLDNFKSVNDTLGHLYGDVVLTQVGSALRRQFRTQDVIGRIGGDEFLVLLKDIPGRKILQERCAALLDALRILLDKLTPGLQVSCSIGAALVPTHGTVYGELFQHADEALYRAKSKGKNQYRIYNARDRYTELNVVSRITHIDSDDPSAVTNDSFERFVFRCLYESQDLDTTIGELLALVGSHFNVSRVYIFENNDENTTCSNTYEWCNEGVVPEKENLQNISYITDIPGWPEVYDEKGVFYCTDITKLAPQFRAILEPQGVKSMLQCAIMDQGVFRGYVGFDECASNRLWTQEQLYQLEFLAEALAVFLVRQRDRSRRSGENQR